MPIPRFRLESRYLRTFGKRSITGRTKQKIQLLILQDRLPLKSQAALQVHRFRSGIEIRITGFNGSIS